jgi:SAM-dependent methyltransferase
MESQHNRTAGHYTLQWGGKLGFLEFIQNNPAAKSVTPASRLGWGTLFEEIRSQASQRTTLVYDAACGFGGIANELIDQSTAAHLNYVGADIHGALDVIARKIPQFARCGLLLRWDISAPLPVEERFDFVICRAALHHTPDPRAAFRSLCAALKRGGTIAISVYSKKSLCREASDDALRNIISKLPEEQAFEVCRQLTALGKALQAVSEKVVIAQDLPLLGVRKGEHAVQELVYYNLLKCFHNEQFGEQYSTLVNYDWYHPEFAYRYDRAEVEGWFKENGLAVLESQSIEVQHYVTGRTIGW